MYLRVLVGRGVVTVCELGVCVCVYEANLCESACGFITQIEKLKKGKKKINKQGYLFSF